MGKLMQEAGASRPTTAGIQPDADEGAIQARHIRVDLIDPDPDQPRARFDETALAELADSIRLHGVIQPIEVEEAGNGRYRLHHGERRWRASLLAQRPTIPAVIAPPRTGGEGLLRALLENLYREDLNAIEEAVAYRSIMRQMGRNRARLARETGRTPALIAGRLAWLELEPEIQRLVALGRLRRDSRLADKLRILPPEVRVPLAEKLAARGIGLKGALAACDRAAEKIAQRSEARAAGAARHAATAGSIPSPNGATPMLALGVPKGMNGHGPTPVTSLAAAAEAMCRRCNIRPRGDLIPAWELVEEEARQTCAACQKRDGAARLDICRLCPGVEMLRRLLTATGGGRD